MYKYLIIIIFPLFFSCSNNKQKKNVEKPENFELKAILQGVWQDENTESPILHIKGDSIYYFDTSIASVYFKIIDDSLITNGTHSTSYHIIKQSEYTLWIQSEIGDLIQLSKVESGMDSIVFPPTAVETPLPSSEVIKKDHIVYHNNVRYRGYVYINPSQMKVVRPEYSEEGFQTDHIYYDNIIHICVFEGKNKLFGKDVAKKDFNGIIPDEFLQWAILSDMDFIGVNENGYQYRASLCIPNETSCYLVNISISEEGELSYSLVE